MTSSTTKIQAVKNGTDTKQADPADKAVGDLRRTEAKSLISTHEDREAQREALVKISDALGRDTGETR